MVNRYFLDTNAVIRLLKGGDYSFISSLEDAEWIGISVITVLEFLSFSGLSKKDVVLFEEFIEQINIVELESENNSLLTSIIQVRKIYRLKLPDAIIAASALQNNATLMTQDKQFLTVKELRVKEINR